MELSSGVIIAIIAVAVGLALLLAVGGIVFFLVKRSKSKQGDPVPGQFSTPSPSQIEAPDGGQQWSQPQQQWAGQVESGQHADPAAPVPTEPAPPWQSGGGVHEPAEQSFPNPSVEQESYSTTPGANLNEPLPNPELFMTTPNTPRQTAAVDGTSAELRADDGTVIKLEGAALRVGRHPECDIVVPTPGASRHHAEFDLRDGAWVVTDLNSGNGTFVNGVRIKTHQLANGDEVRVDQTRFVFSFNG